MAKRRKKRRRPTVQEGSSVPQKVEPDFAVEHEGAGTPGGWARSWMGRFRPGRTQADPGRGRGTPSGVRSSPGVARRGGGTASATSAPAYPGAGLSMARGLSAVGRSPAVLAVSFLGVLGLWAGFTAHGVFLSASPAAMIHLNSLPPLHSLLLDIQFVTGGQTTAGLETAAFAVGLLAVRAVLLAMLTSLLLRSLQRSSAPTADRDSAQRAPSDHNADGETRETIRRAMRSFPAVLAIETGSLVLAATSLFVSLGFLGSTIGQLGVIAALVGGMYLFIFAPIVAVAEGMGARASVVLAMRAARLPGRHHVLFTFGYISIAIFLSLASPVARVAEATPSFTVWLYVLFVTFLHAGALGAFAFRWLAVRRYLVEPETVAPEEVGSLR